MKWRHFRCFHGRGGRLVGRCAAPLFIPRGLDSRDAALASRLTYGTVQNQILLDWYLRHFSSVRLKKIAPRVLACLRMGLYQLILMDKIPAHAAVAETVALVKHYGHANDRTVAFANAVLRNAANAAQNGSLPRPELPG